MTNPRILMVIGGGIAAYKSCELVRLIRKGGGEVVCVLTEGGAQFVTPMALAALSGSEVFTSLWDLKNEAEIGHIELSRQADLIVVCPATANLMAKMAAGIADDLATTMLLATDKPVLTVPAMNVRMWEHEATQRNIASLKEMGTQVLQPDEGLMACGEFGPGRLPEPERVWLEIADMLGLDPMSAGVSPLYNSQFNGEEEGYDEEEGEGYEPDSDKAPSGKSLGGLGGLLSSIIPRSRKAVEEEEEGEALPDDYIGPDLPEPDFTQTGSLMANKGTASAAPPTDREAINHEVNAMQNAPQPFEGEEAAAPVMPMAEASAANSGGPEAISTQLDDFDALAGQPAFEEDIEHRPLYGKHILVTAGPTHEAIDPVRYLANRSSGKQGFAIAAAAAAAGARVTLIAGPVNLKTPLGVDRIDVESALDMAEAVKSGLPSDAAVMVAAVADWRPRDFQDEKIKKRGSAPPALALDENPDILATLAASPDRPDLLIGFAAETENVIANARKKRKAKGVDWIVANDVSGDVMGGEDNQVHLIYESRTEEWETMSKQEVAAHLIIAMAERLNADD